MFGVENAATKKLRGVTKESHLDSYQSLITAGLDTSDTTNCTTRCFEKYLVLLDISACYRRRVKMLTLST